MTSDSLQFFSREGLPLPVSRLYRISAEKGTARYQVERPCSRCGGAGESARWIATGRVCFDCRGTGKHKNGPVERKAYTAEKLAKLNAAQERSTAKRVEKARIVAAERKAKNDTERKAFRDAHPGIIEFLESEDGNTEFLANLLDKFLRLNSLTEKQVEVVRRAIEKAATRAASGFVGTVGERITLTVTAERVFTIGDPASRFGCRFMFLCRDGAGNRIVYRGNGSAMPNEGETSTVTATVASHDTYKGEKQTVIQRPKAVVSDTQNFPLDHTQKFD